MATIAPTRPRSHASEEQMLAALRNLAILRRTVGGALDSTFDGDGRMTSSLPATTAPARWPCNPTGASWSPARGAR